MCRVREAAGCFSSHSASLPSTGSQAAWLLGSFRPFPVWKQDHTINIKPIKVTFFSPRPFPFHPKACHQFKLIYFMKETTFFLFEYFSYSLVINSLWLRAHQSRAKYMFHHPPDGLNGRVRASVIWVNSIWQHLGLDPPPEIFFFFLLQDSQRHSWFPKTEEFIISVCVRALETRETCFIAFYKYI